MIISLSLFLLFFLFCIVFPVAPSFFETPKIIFAEVGIDILIFVSLLQGNFFKKGRYWNLVPFIGVFILTIFDLFFFQTSFTLFGNPFRLQGILLLWHLMLFAMITSAITLPTYIWKIALVALGILLISIPIFGSNESGRWIGLLGDPNSLAATAIFFWPFIIVSQKAPKWLKIGTVGLMIAILFVTVSRSAMIAFAVQLVFLFLTSYKKTSLQLALFVSLICMMSCLLLPFFDTHRVWESRSEIWQTAWTAGFSRPILGSGYGNVETALFTSSNMLSNTLRFEYVDSSHNLILDWWVQGGIIGVLLLFWMLIQSIIVFIQTQNKREIILLLGVVTCLLFNPASIVTLVQLWWLLGKGISFVTD